MRMVPGLPSMRNAERYARIPAYFKLLWEPPDRRQLQPIRS